MQIQQKKDSGPSSQETRKHPFQAGGRKRKNERAQRGAGDDAITGPGLHLLEKELRSKSLFELATLTENGRDTEIFKIVDTEEKQLQAIEDLHAIVKAQPKYKALKEYAWKATDSPIVVLYWLLRKLGPLAQGNRWTVDTYREGSKTRYRYVTYRHYHRQYVKDREEHMALDFLPALKKRDQPLHDMIIDLVALVSRQNKIPLWDEDGDYSKTLADLKGLVTSPNDNNQLHRQKISYTEGPAADYLKLIRQRREVVSAKTLISHLERYNANSDRKHAIVWWVKKGVEIAESGKCISTNTYVPNYVQGKPLTPYRLYKFIWSLHDNDYVKVKTWSRLTKDEKNSGTYLPVEFSIAKPGELLKPICTDRFPMALYEFMCEGVKMMCYRFREYFYKMQIESQQTPAEHFLEALENASIQKLDVKPKPNPLLLIQ